LVERELGIMKYVTKKSARYSMKLRIWENLVQEYESDFDRQVKKLLKKSSRRGAGSDDK
jgi:hypothetical protein